MARQDSQRGKRRRGCAPRTWGFARRLRFESLEERRLLADLRITSVQLIEPDRVGVSVTPLIGQRVCVKASFATSAIPAGASYRVEYVVDGVALSHTISSGAGVPSGNYYAFRCGWYATPGTHAVEKVTLDVDNVIAETDEGNNLLAPNLGFTPVAPNDLTQKFIHPMGGALFRDWRTNNYHDVDPLEDKFEDYREGIFTYDGHAADDISLPNFARMDAGIPVYAAADGIVATTADGNFDRNSERGSRPANFVTIEHSNGWETIYYHFARNTIVVQPGQAVRAGDLLGLAGSSGDSSGPHLHFGIRHYGGAVEPMYQPELFYEEPLVYQADLPTTVLDMGITDFVPTDADFLERPPDTTLFTAYSQASVTVWFRYSNFKAGEQFQYKWYLPSGNPSQASTVTVASDRRGGWYRITRTIINFSAAAGKWRVAIEKNGVELASRTFEITPEYISAQMRLTAADGSLILDQRTTPIDFGTSAQGAVGTNFSFTVTNSGSAPLELSNLVVPPGFELSLPLAASVPAGSATTFEVRLLTAVAGTKLGAVEFLTNDPDTPRFSFFVTGVVSGSPPSYVPVITLGGPAAATRAFGPAVVLRPAADVVDADTTDFAGGKLSVEFVASGSADDRLLVVPTGTGSGQIDIRGSLILFAGAEIGEFSGGTSGEALMIALRDGATLPAVRALLRSIGFQTTALNAKTLARYVRFQLTDGDGNESNQAIAVVVQDMRPTTLHVVDGDLQIVDTSPAGKIDRWRLERDGDQLKITDLDKHAIDVSSIGGASGQGTAVVRFPLAALGSDFRLLVDSRYGKDQVLLVPSFGDPAPGGVTLLSGTSQVSAIPPNVAPTMNAVAPVIVLEDGGLQAVLLEGIAPGAGELQALGISAWSDEVLLLSPAVDYASPESMATLRFGLAANESGQSMVTVTLKDNGGVMSGGIDTLTRTVMVTVLPVNDAPDFSMAPRASATDDSGPQIFHWAKNVSWGAVDESDQEIAFEVVSNSEPQLFSDAPNMDPEGYLRFTPEPNAKGIAVIGVRLKDNGGTENGGQDTSAIKYFEIEVTKPFPLHNSRHALDVTGVTGTPDQRVTGADALAVINFINAFGPSSVPMDFFVAPPYYDTTGGANGGGDNLILASDALAVINFINAFGIGLPGPEGEGAVAGNSRGSADGGPEMLSIELEALLAMDIVGRPRRRGV